MPSPCVKVCKVEAEVCVGCGRTLEDLKAWATATEAEQQAITEAAKRRMK
jgi:predicted Fe-S protein YdhL (DUF1289 family)